jgi:hypothetical protein
MAGRKRAEPKTAASDIDREFQPVVAAFADHRDVAGGRMMSSYCLKVKGKIFAMFGRPGFVVKLPRERVDALVGAGCGRRFDPGHGRLMKEWVVVDEGKADWIDLAREAYRFVKRGRS